MMLETIVTKTTTTTTPNKATAQGPTKGKSVAAETGTLLTNARVLVAHGEKELALNLLREASNRDSKNPAVLLPLAETLESLGRDSEAIYARKALAKYEYNFENVFQHAQALYRLNRDEEAMSAYYEALSILTDGCPQLFDIHKNMGNIFVRRGDFEGAEESYHRAYSIRPHSDTLMVNLATLELQRGDQGRALACFRQAVDKNVTNEKAWTGLAMIHNDIGDHDLAWGNIERALDLNAGNRTAVLLVSNWAMRDQTPWRAISWVENYLAAVETDEEMSIVLVNLFCSSGQLDLAGLESERILAWNPDRQDVRAVRAKLAGSQNSQGTQGAA